jgi:hypothetical protein
MKVVGALLVVAIVGVLAPALARAHEDPASDYLLAQDVFLPYDAKIPASKAKQLQELIANAAKSGFRVKVAVIAKPVDLGSVPQFYGKPQRYAVFLGNELKSGYRGRLLVGMPSGYGYAVGGKGAHRNVVAQIASPGRDPLRIVNGAEFALQRLAATHGTRLRVPTAASGTTTQDRIMIAAVALAGVAVVTAAAAYRRKRVRA